MSIESNVPRITGVDRAAPAAILAPKRRWGWLHALVVIETLAIGSLIWKLRDEGTRWSQRNAFLHASLGRDKEDAGDLKTAVGEYRAATQLYPENAKAWYLLGKALRQTNSQSGQRELQRAAALAPGDAAILVEYGEALLDNAKPDEARTVLTRVVALKPDNEAAHVALGRAYLGNIGSAQDLEHGLQELRAALALQPGEVQARFRLARALFQANRVSEAEQEFRTALSLLAEGARQRPEPMDGATGWSHTWLSLVKGCHHYLSDIAYREGRRAEAEHQRQLFDRIEDYLRDSYDLLKRQKQNPGDPEVQRQLAQVFVRHGFSPRGPDGPAAATRWAGL